jgi:hypothetical protein
MQLNYIYITIKVPLNHSQRCRLNATKILPLACLDTPVVELAMLYMSGRDVAVDGMLVEKLVEHSVVKKKDHSF